jgi:purine-binding chemotaxis protein CheW
MDTRQRFGLKSSEVNEDSRIVIIEADGQVIGILVDAVAEVVYLRASEIESPPKVGNEESTSFIHGVSNKNGKLLILVDLSRMLTDEEWSEVQSI